MSYKRFFEINTHLLPIGKPLHGEGFIVLDVLADYSNNPHPFVYHVHKSAFGFHVSKVESLIPMSISRRNGEWVTSEMKG